MKEKRSIKEYTEDEIEKINDPLELYNLLIQPVSEMKTKIESSSSKINNAVVAVYGATTYPLLRRMNALNKLSKYVNVDNGIIISGGRSWTSVVPSSYTYRPSLREIRDYINNGSKELSQYSKEEIEQIEEKIKQQKITKYIQMKNKLIRGRARDILKEFPSVKEQLYIREKEIWEKYLEDYKKEYAMAQENNSNNPMEIPPKYQNYDEMYDDFLNEKVNKSKNCSAKELKDLYNIYRNEKLKEHKKTPGFQKWYKKYKKNSSIGIPFYKWLKTYYDRQHYEDLVLRNITEVDLMKIKLNHLSEEQVCSKIIEDKKATNSAENAINTVKEFIKLKQKNPELKQLIVISEWQYLLRQVLTTQKAAKDLGLDDIEIIGYPADIDYQNNIGMKFKDLNSCRNAFQLDLKKIATYEDVSDYSLKGRSKKSNLDENAPKIFIGDKTLEEIFKAQSQEQPTITDR